MNFKFEKLDFVLCLHVLIAHPSHTHHTPIVHPSHTHHTAITNQSHTNHTPITHSSYTHLTPITHPSRTHHKPISPHHTPITHPSLTHHTPITHPSHTNLKPITHRHPHHTPPRLTHPTHPSFPIHPFYFTYSTNYSLLHFSDTIAFTDTHFTSTETLIRDHNVSACIKICKNFISESKSIMPQCSLKACSDSHLMRYFAKIWILFCFRKPD